jgi:hypothetical protein
MATLLSPTGISIFSSKGLAILLTFYRSLARPLYFAKCDIDPEQAAGERAVRIIHVVLDRVQMTLTIAAPLIFQIPLRSTTLPGSKFPNLRHVMQYRGEERLHAAGSGAYT